jgi:AbrB family looped-hinge helix DNA binding protein
MAYTLTTKSQVTLPKPIRDHLKVAPGDAVEFRIVADGSVRVQPVKAVSSKAPRARVEKFRKLQGIGGEAGGSTDALMSLLRGYDEDAGDPGLAPRVVPRRSRK